MTDIDEPSNESVGLTEGEVEEDGLHRVLRELIDIPHHGRFLYNKDIEEALAIDHDAAADFILDIYGEDLPEDVEKRSALVWTTDNPDSVFALAEDEDGSVREQVAANENTPVSVLIELARDKNRDVRIEVAANENTPVAVLIELAEDGYWPVRQSVAANENTPVSILTMLAEDKHEVVRASVAQNKNTPVPILTMLAEDGDEEVRTDVADNANTPFETLTLLSEDKDPDVSKLAKKNLQERQGNQTS